MVDEDRAAAGAVSAINIAPAIANQEAFVQLDIQSCRRAPKHPRLWFPAFARLAMSSTRVKTNFDSIQRGNRRAQYFVHRLDGFAALGSPADIRLVRYHDQKKAGRF